MSSTPRRLEPSSSQEGECGADPARGLGFYRCSSVEQRGLAGYLFVAKLPVGTRRLYGSDWRELRPAYLATGLVRQGVT